MTPAHITPLAQGVIANGSRVVGEWRPGVELNAFERGKDEHCLKKIHPQFPEARNGLELDRNLIGPAGAIQFNAGSQYTIRAFSVHRITGDELAVNPECLGHRSILSAESEGGTLAQASQPATVLPTGGVS